MPRARSQTPRLGRGPTNARVGSRADSTAHALVGAPDLRVRAPRRDRERGVTGDASATWRDLASWRHVAGLAAPRATWLAGHRRESWRRVANLAAATVA